MSVKDSLPGWVRQALKELGGSGTIVEVARIIWRDHESGLKAGGDLFYTWQYDMRWAANKLRRSGDMKAADVSPRGVWELAR